MVAIALDRASLALAADLSVQLLFDIPGVDDDDQRAGEIRTYGERQRSITIAGNRRSLQLEPDWLTRADVATLRSWRGQVVLYRDPTGRKVYGVFHKIRAKPYVLNEMEQVALTLVEVTVSEAV